MYRKLKKKNDKNTRPGHCSIRLNAMFKAIELPA